MQNRYLLKLSNIYIYLIAFSILPVLFFTKSSMSFNNLFEIIFWIALQIAADYKPIMRFRGTGVSEQTMSLVVQISAIILLGVGQAVWTIIIATLIVEITSKKPLHKALFNVGQYGLSLMASGYMFHFLKLSHNDKVLDIIMDMPAVLAAVITYFFLNAFFVAAVISLTTGSRFLPTFFSDFKELAFYYCALTPISLAVALLYAPHRPYIILIMVPSVIMVDQALRRYFDLQQETQKTLKVLANTIDERDQYTSAHSVRVAEYAKKTAEKLNLSDDTVIEIEMAGRVHDLGKVGVEDNILRKEGTLSDEEFAQIKKHPEIAYNLLKNLKPYKNGANYVLYHHEYLNGKGYPVRISGKDIPLGARILTAVDSYDAMTSDRPYRKALSKTIAVNELRRYSGTQFDPVVVNAFIEILKSDYNYLED